MYQMDNATYVNKGRPNVPKNNTSNALKTVGMYQRDNATYVKMKTDCTKDNAIYVKKRPNVPNGKCY